MVLCWLSFVPATCSVRPMVGALEMACQAGCGAPVPPLRQTPLSGRSDSGMRLMSYLFPRASGLSAQAHRSLSPGLSFPEEGILHVFSSLYVILARWGEGVAPRYRCGD